ncbi:MAG: hypothetical protein HZB71_14010 [Betaproteobacteria bacterium]|nr:hypothetical protein [Betaproteobacteria bacterium]
MSKLIFFALLGLAVVLWYKHQANKRVRDASKPADKPVENMVRCAQCGVNLPRSEAILSQGKFYCCEAHRQGAPDA